MQNDSRIVGMFWGIFNCIGVRLPDSNKMMTQCAWVDLWLQKPTDLQTSSVEKM